MDLVYSGQPLETNSTSLCWGSPTSSTPLRAAATYPMGRSISIRWNWKDILELFTFKEIIYQDYYKPVGIEYKGLKLVDIDQTNIREHVDDVVDFIDAALREGGKVLVNCNLGMSRSAACTCAYLIVRHKMTLNQAINQVARSV